MSLNNYQIIKSKRKSLGIRIKLDGSVIIRVPLKKSALEINQFVDKYQSWIETKLAHVQIAQAQKVETNLYYYLGEQYPVQEADCADLVQFSEQKLLIRVGCINQAENLLIPWYRLQTKQLVAPIVEEYAKQFGLVYTTLKITLAKTRWGSCNSRGTLCFSYRLAMLPLYVIKYIVAHELAHLKHLNHAPAFWCLVGQIYPDYKAAQAWLKTHKYVLAASL